MQIIRLKGREMMREAIMGLKIMGSVRASMLRRDSMYSLILSTVEETESSDSMRCLAECAARDPTDFLPEGFLLWELFHSFLVDCREEMV